MTNTPPKPHTAIKTKFTTPENNEIVIFVILEDSMITFYNSFGVEFAQTEKHQTEFHFVNDAKLRYHMRRLQTYFLTTEFSKQPFMFPVSSIELMTDEDLIICGWKP